MEESLNSLISAAIAEDAAARDLTTEILVEKSLRGSGRIVAKAEGVISGQECSRAVFKRIDPGLQYEESALDGQRVSKGSLVAEVKGNLSSILTAERIALNFLGHLSGIATMTSLFVEKAVGSGIVILDTRKTTPGLRVLEKKAVRDGGGENHRADLSALILVKENHINAAGGIKEAVARLGRDNIARSEIEVDSIEALRFLLDDPPMRIMLDNFTPDMVREAVADVAEVEGTRPQIEVSGGVSLQNISDYCIPGVDYISIGGITSSAPSLDISLITEVIAE